MTTASLIVRLLVLPALFLLSSSSSPPAVASGPSEGSALDRLRGGGGGSADDAPRDVILRFLRSPSPDDDDEGDAPSRAFHIQGWRWHSMSLMRDSYRLGRLVDRLSRGGWGDGSDVREGLEALDRAAGYVVEFNMAGLFRVESTMFMEFLGEHLCDEGGSIGRFGGSGKNSTTEAGAFKEVLDEIDEHRTQSERIGRELRERARAASDPSVPPHVRRRNLDEIGRSCERLAERIRSMRELQETLVVPAVARVVPSKVQKSFNNRVLLNLGLLESRTHLVGMRDAVWESDAESERKKFEEEIPYVARAMIERWRKSLYVPRAGALDYGL